MQLNQFIEATSLSMTLQGKDVESLIQEAIRLGCVGVCVPPYWVKKAQREIGEEPLQLVTVIGYPLGYQMSETKVVEARRALEDGANELDVVVNAAAFLSDPSWVKVELAKLAGIAHDQGAMLKAILEVDLWDNEQLKKLLAICAAAGVDFAKTSTGYHRAAVTPEIIRFFRSQLPSNVGIKASGGIRTKSQALELIEAGAERLGTSSALEILQ